MKFMNWLIEHIKSKNEQIAVIFNDRSYSYISLYSQIELYYQQVKRDYKKGETIAIVADYSFESIALFLALCENNNIIVPITSKIENEVNERLEVACCNYSIYIESSELISKKHSFNKETHDLVRELGHKGNSGLILFSSGSTGSPKAMIHNLDNLIDSYKNKKGKNLVFLIFLMFDHIGGLNTLLNCLSMGVTMVFPYSREPDHVVALIEKYSVNILPASPTFLNLILISQAYERYNLSSLRMITYGTEPMPETLLLKLKDVFDKVKFLQTFGTSETGIAQISSKSSTSTLIKIDDPNTEFKIIDGELWIRSKTQIMGYLNSSMERFTSDGWFRTGDLVEEAEDGYIKIVGRNTDVINVGGEKVLPAEIESVLFQMPNVKDCVVFGENNPITGQMVTAKILFNEELRPSEAKKCVVKFCSDKLEKYKVPAKVILMTKSEYSDRFKKKRI